MTFLLIALLFFLAWRTTATGLRMRRKEREAQQAQQARLALRGAEKQGSQLQMQQPVKQRQAARKLQLELSSTGDNRQEPAAAAAPNPKQLATSSTQAEWQIAAAAAIASDELAIATTAAASVADEPGTPSRPHAGPTAPSNSPGTPAPGRGQQGQRSPEQCAPAAVHLESAAAERASKPGSVAVNVPQLPLAGDRTGSSSSSGGAAQPGPPLSGRSLVPASPAPADLVAAASSRSAALAGSPAVSSRPASHAGNASSLGSASDGSDISSDSEDDDDQLAARQASWLSAPLMLDGVLEPSSNRSSPAPSHWGLLASTVHAPGARPSGSRRQGRRERQRQRSVSQGVGAQPTQPAAQPVQEQEPGTSQLDSSSMGALQADSSGAWQVGAVRRQRMGVFVWCYSIHVCSAQRPTSRLAHVVPLPSFHTGLIALPAPHPALLAGPPPALPLGQAGPDRSPVAAVQRAAAEQGALLSLLLALCAALRFPGRRGAVPGTAVCPAGRGWSSCRPAAGV